MASLRTGKTRTGRGVFSVSAITKGAHIIEMTGERMSARQVEEAIDAGTIRADDPFQIGEERFIKLDKLPYLFNHSCEPNAGFRRGRFMVALRDIKKGEEICYDYSAVVCSHCQWRMRCRCGSKHCRNLIGNVKSLPRSLRARYRAQKLLPAFIERELA